MNWRDLTDRQLRAEFRDVVDGYCFFITLGSHTQHDKHEFANYEDDRLGEILNEMKRREIH